MDRARSRHVVLRGLVGAATVGAIRSRFGAASGDDWMAVTDDDATTYDLSIRGADPDGPLIDATYAAELEAEDTHRFVASLPETAAESGSIERVDGERPSRQLAGIGLAGTALGATVYGGVRDRLDL